MSSEITVQPQQQVHAGLTLHDQMTFAQAVAQSDIIPTVYRGKPANVLVAVGYGAPLGLSPMQSLQDISVINGKPTASASFIASRVRMAGHKLRIVKDEKQLSVTATIVRSDDLDYPISVTRDRAWAQQMGLISKDNYKKQPLTMLTWRAITAAAREACPEILYGVQYTADELHDFDPPTRQHSTAPSDDVTATVEDEEPAQKPEPPAQPTQQMASKAQADAINGLLHECGVDSTDMAQYVFHAHTGLSGITSATQLSRIDAENLTASKDVLKQRTMQAIEEYRKQHQPEEAAEEKKEA